MSLRACAQFCYRLKLFSDIVLFMLAVSTYLPTQVSTSCLPDESSVETTGQCWDQILQRGHWWHVSFWAGWCSFIKMEKLSSTSDISDFLWCYYVAFRLLSQTIQSCYLIKIMSTYTMSTWASCRETLSNVDIILFLPHPVLDEIRSDKIRLLLVPLMVNLLVTAAAQMNSSI